MPTHTAAPPPAQETAARHADTAAPSLPVLPELAPRSLALEAPVLALRAAISAACRVPEPEALTPLLAQARLAPALDAKVHGLALRLATALRTRKSASGRAGLVQSLLQEFSLSSHEGVALMCLAEALLRIPDKATRDALIRDKISAGQWADHLGKSPSLFVNAATWGLLLTGKLVSTHSETGLGHALGRLIGKGGEPLIRKAVDMAMRMMGEQFVTGETIAQALENAREREAQGFRYSYDMLGEAALTAADADTYYASYEQAIHAIGRAAQGRGITQGPGISIKLSALHPRYSRAQWQRVMDELYPRVLALTELAYRYNIGLNIDAEEADRLELSLDLLERLCHAPSLRGWNGIGFVIQAYQKRCPQVVAYLIDLARRSQRRLMVRLVKGAYWDSEIKRAQVDGLSDYPVYTRKAHTDVSYIACARQLLAAPEAIYPQFATHNAHTVAAIYELAEPARYWPGQYEFQCLHGMGEPLYEQVVGEAAALNRPCRIYAPVGTHETLLAYLVRRLLENGANTSFVNRVADTSLPLEALVKNPVREVEDTAPPPDQAPPGQRHPHIPLPAGLYGSARTNSSGLDLSCETALAQLQAALHRSAAQCWTAGPLLESPPAPGPYTPVRNPAHHAEVVGQVQDATAADVDAALRHAAAGSASWAATAPTVRAQMLEGAADALQLQLPDLMALLMREAGKSASNAVAEVREAIDFLRYYAAQSRAMAGDVVGDAAGNALDTRSWQPLGPVVCISPWNFPLAIFLGQVSAALAAGNTVLAKPAEQTPLIAAEAVRLLWQAGVPRSALQLLPGPGETVGAQLVGDVRTMGVLFTGSTEVARILQRTLAGRLDAAGRPVTLIAETGGQNAMVIDSSALVEQAVNDAVASAFDSAGQRCSALRVLCVQDDVAPRLLAMLEGAMAELTLGNPAALASDVGPVIDTDAQRTIEQHIATLRARGHRVVQHAAHLRTAAQAPGSFVPPTVIEIGQLSELQREVFGPVLHVLRYARDDLDGLLAQINATGYGLTLGLHTRIDETIARVTRQARAGNVYVNRNMVGAVVGVQPFGGEGLSGTGPKAGGPLYLLRLCRDSPAQALPSVLGAADSLSMAAPSTALAASGGTESTPSALALQALQHWAHSTGAARIAQACSHFATRAQVLAGSRTLAGPTGERNTYHLQPRSPVLCSADSATDLLVQTAAALAVGAAPCWPQTHQPLAATLPREVQSQLQWAAGHNAQGSVAHAANASAPSELGAVLHHGDASTLLSLCAAVAQRPGPIVGVTALQAGDDAIPLERLVLERALSVNTAAAGGNASLMTMG